MVWQSISVWATCLLVLYTVLAGSPAQPVSSDRECLCTSTVCVSCTRDDTIIKGTKIARFAFRNGCTYAPTTTNHVPGASRAAVCNNSDVQRASGACVARKTATFRQTASLSIGIPYAFAGCARHYVGAHHGKTANLQGTVRLGCAWTTRGRHPGAQEPRETA